MTLEVEGVVHHQEQSQVMVSVEVVVVVVLNGDGLLHGRSLEMDLEEERCLKDESRDSIEAIGERQYQGSNLVENL